jgi:hypothetical protein
VTCWQVLWTVTVEGLSSSNARTSYREPVVISVGVASGPDAPSNTSLVARSSLSTAGVQTLVLVRGSFVGVSIIML